MSLEWVRTIFTYLIALVVIIGGGLLLIIPTRLAASELLPFLTGAIGVVLGYVFAERATTAANANFPTITTTTGPPPEIQVSNTEGD